MASNKRSPWLGHFSNKADCQAAGALAPRFSPRPLDDLFLAGTCAICQRKSRFRLSKDQYLDEWGYLFRETLSCDHCGFNSRMRAALQYGLELIKRRPEATIYLTEQVTPLYRYLRYLYPHVQGSELLPGVKLGTLNEEGVRCEDLQALSFSDESFDIIMSLDVLEHVPDYHAGLRELRRVLKPGGVLIMTVPFTMHYQGITFQARQLEDGTVEHLIEPPEYHGNPLGPPSLSFRTFGWDLLADMRAAGFGTAVVVPYKESSLGFVGGPFPLVVGTATL